MIDNVMVFRDKSGAPYIEVECESCRGEGEHMIAKLYPSGHTEVWERCEDCFGEGCVGQDIIEPYSPWKTFYGVTHE